jgi:hypothetical protein
VSHRRVLRHACTALLAALPTLADAHGINGHVHVTGWAVESLPPGELHTFFADAALRDTAQIGAAFPDSGYAIGDPYGEMAHWEPFINAYVEWIIATFGPTYETEEARRHIAFMMGAAAHGLQDEIFDTHFLRYLIQEDGQDQDAADSGTDAFLFTDGVLEFKPPLYIPETGLQAVFTAAHDYAPDQSQIRAGMQRVKILVIDRFAAVAPMLDAQYRPLLPWGSTHYLDPEVPGSLRAEIQPTAAYMLALWERLHGRYTPQMLATHTYPTSTRRLRGADHTRVDSRIGVVFGIGAIVGTLNEETVRLFGPGETPVSLDVQHTRWTGRPDDATRQVVLVPLEDLALDTEYEVRLLPGIELQDGRRTDSTWTYRFRTPCPAEGPCSPGPEAMPLDPPRVPYPPPPDAGLPRDAGLPPSADAAPPGPDAALAPADAAPPEPDAASATPDAQSAPISAGPTADAGSTGPGANGSGTGSSGGCVTAAPGSGPAGGAIGLFAALAGLGACRRNARRLRSPVSAARRLSASLPRSP